MALNLIKLSDAFLSDLKNTSNSFVFSHLQAHGLVQYLRILLFNDLDSETKIYIKKRSLFREIMGLLSELDLEEFAGLPAHFLHSKDMDRILEYSFRQDSGTKAFLLSTENFPLFSSLSQTLLEDLFVEISSRVLRGIGISESEFLQIATNFRAMDTSMQPILVALIRLGSNGKRLLGLLSNQFDFSVLKDGRKIGIIERAMLSTAFDNRLIYDLVSMLLGERAVVVLFHHFLSNDDTAAMGFFLSLKYVTELSRDWVLQEITDFSKFFGSAMLSLLYTAFELKMEELIRPYISNRNEDMIIALFDLLKKSSLSRADLTQVLFLLLGKMERSGFSYAPVLRVLELLISKTFDEHFLILIQRCPQALLDRFRTSIDVYVDQTGMQFIDQVLVRLFIMTHAGKGDNKERFEEFFCIEMAGKEEGIFRALLARDNIGYLRAFKECLGREIIEKLIDLVFEFSEAKKYHEIVLMHNAGFNPSESVDLLQIYREWLKTPSPKIVRYYLLMKSKSVV